MRYHILTWLLLLLPVWVWAQKELVIEGPNDKVAPVTLQVKSDFDQEKGILKLTFSGDNTSESNALWFLQEATSYRNLTKYFKKLEGRLSLSSFAKEQIKFMNLGEKTADPVVLVANAQLTNMGIQTKEGFKTNVQKQILPLDDRSTMTLTLQVSPEAETVTVTLKNPMLLLNKGKKYQLAFIGKEVSVDFDVTIDYCASHAELLTQLQEYNKVFGKGEAALQQAQGSCVDMIKSLLISEITQVDLKRFENTKCQDVEDQLAALRDLLDRITNYELPKNGGGGVSGDASGGASGDGTGTKSGSDAMPPECNPNQINKALKEAVYKMNNFANEWMLATDPTVKQAKKLAFDNVIKVTDAKINELSPACKKRIDSKALNNYEAAKKLITN